VPVALSHGHAKPFHQRPRRTAICELLDLTDRIREMIVDRRPTSEIKRIACEEGMITLRESRLAKIRAGITTVKEINKVTFVE
jgi:type IV pilus assembly protein PilB